MLFNSPVKIWETPEITSICRLPMHTTYHPCATVDEALNRARPGSSWTASLNGTWKLQVFRHPGEVLAEHVRNGVDYSGWAQVPVPANWNLHGFGKPPQYTNINMPFVNEPPLVPDDDNPTGVYRTGFSLPDNWNGRRVIIHFGGVESCFFVYLNGEFIGMSKDSRLPAEFDLTASLRPGGNELAVVCLQYSDASYIEDQDHWWMAGIFRDVYLYSTESIYLADIRIDGKFEPDTGDCCLQGMIVLGADTEPEEDCRVEVQVYDGSRELLEKPLRQNISRSYRLDSYRTQFVHSLGKLKPWNTEEPYLYTVLVTLFNASGRAIEHAAVRTGFRSVEIKDRQFLLNGKPVLIKGVNHHDADPDNGKFVARKWVERDILLLKQFNLNAIRTSHYPADPLLYDLCDEHGILVIDEANIECHANYCNICHEPRWRNAFVERILRMVRRDRNHACIFAWSLCNESGYGENHDAAADQVRALDPTRLLHNEGAVKPRWDQGGPNAYGKGGERSNDMINPMYPAVADMIDWAVNASEPRPFIMCEYCSTTGNSGGCLKEYWDAIHAHHGLQGGFIWQWCDHALRRQNADGKDFWAYGGDFGETLHDYNFNCNGIVSPDRQPRPVLYEYKKLVQPMHFRVLNLETFEFEITNDDWFRNSDWLDCIWRLEIDGCCHQEGSLECAVAPQQVLRATLPVEPFSLTAGAQAVLSFSCRSRRQTAWCDKGHEIAWEQFVISEKPLPLPVPTAAVELIQQDSRRIMARAGNTDILISVPQGTVESLSMHGKQVLAAGPAFNLWRAPIDNDGTRARQSHRENLQKNLGRWLAAGLDRMQIQTLHSELDIKTPGILVFRVSQAACAPGTEDRITFTSEYSFYGDGCLRCTHKFKLPNRFPEPPRLGVMFKLGAGFEQVEWYGRGPHESYPDRKTGARLGRFRGSVREQHHDYIVPQETGLKCDTRSFRLFGSETILEVRDLSGAGFAFSAQHYTPHELQQAFHTDEVVFKPETTVLIDAVHRGIGSNACGPDTLPEYRIFSGVYKLDYELRLTQRPLTVTRNYLRQ